MKYKLRESKSQEEQGEGQAPHRLRRPGEEGEGSLEQGGGTAKEIFRSRGYSLLFIGHERVNKLTGDPEELMFLCRFNRPSNIDRDQPF